uniref:BHLH domain-containing protein n=1 Tax=Panagrellus redivivus TaxID=6233 RepID=A0A7E4UMH4_PANRE
MLMSGAGLGSSSSTSSASNDNLKRAGSSDSDDSIASKKSRLTMINAETGELEPYVRKRRSSVEKAKLKSRLESLDPEEQDRVRQTINSRERKRMHNLNFALDDLRDSLPSSRGASSRKLSKINTIVCATDWIRQIQKDNALLRQKLTDLGAEVPPLPTFNNTLEHISVSPAPSEVSFAAIKTMAKSPPTPSVQKPPTDPAPVVPTPPMPMFPPAFFAAGFPQLFLQQQAAAAAAHLQNIQSQKFMGIGHPIAAMLPGDCMKHLNNGGICFCSKCFLNKCGNVTCNN